MLDLLLASLRHQAHRGPLLCLERSLEDGLAQNGSPFVVSGGPFWSRSTAHMPTEGGLGGSCMVRALTALAIPKVVLTHVRSPVGILHLEGSLAFSTWSVKVLLLLASPDTPTGIPLFSENCSNSSWNHLWPQCFPNPSVPMSKLRLSGEGIGDRLQQAVAMLHHKPGLVLSSCSRGLTDTVP